MKKSRDKSQFEPAWWLPHAHLQTLWQGLCRRDIKNLQITRERFELPDGDFVDLDWAGKNSGPIVLILHGLEGSITSHYAQGMLSAVEHHGWRGVLMNFRGCSGEHNRLPRLYHAGETHDLETIIQALLVRYPGIPITAIGFSLGGNVLLKWLGETSEHNPLTAAIAISIPFELDKSVARINRGFSRVYQQFLLSSLNKKVNADFKTLHEFDDKVTAPLHGFVDAKDYYTKSSCRQYLHLIRVPTLLLQAKDDPFMTDDLLPNDHELSTQVTLEIMKNGGHVGFISGRFPWHPQYWLEKRAPEFLSEYLS